jgi:hypothetical protein
VLHILFALDRGADVIVNLKIDQPLQSVLFRETSQKAFAMFADAPNEVSGDADVKRPIRSIGEDVNVACHASESLSWMAGTSPAMTI